MGYSAQEFKQLAQQNISADPMTRVPSPIKRVLEKHQVDSTDTLFFDIHPHCFTYNNVPSGFPGMGVHLPDFVLSGLGKAVNGIGYLLSAGKRKESTYWNFYSKKRLLKKFAQYDSADAVLMHQFGLYNMAFRLKKRKRPHIIMTHLMMDMERGVKGEAKQGFYDQLVELSTLRQKRKHDHVILPFLATDPRNPNLYEDFLAVFTDSDKRINKTKLSELDDAFPFFGVKIYPSLGYFPSDPKLMEIFEICAAKNIPVTTHCGGGSTRYNNSKWVKGSRMIWKEGQLEEEPYEIKARYGKKTGKRMAELFNAPNLWIPVIKAFPKLKLNLAHFGSDLEWANYRDGLSGSHVDQTLDLITEYPNVYGDISYSCAFDRNLWKIRGWFAPEQFTEERRATLLRKILYGSDYYMTDNKKSLVTIVKSVFEELEQEQLDHFCVTNPKTFLFEAAK